MTKTKTEQEYLDAAEELAQEWISSRSACKGFNAVDIINEMGLPTPDLWEIIDHGGVYEHPEVDKWLTDNDDCDDDGDYWTAILSLALTGFPREIPTMENRISDYQSGY